MLPQPWRRIAWELPLAILIVLLLVLGIGHRLQQPQLKPSSKPQPILARIYELPPAPAAAPAKPTPLAPQPAHPEKPARQMPVTPVVKTPTRRIETPKPATPPLVPMIPKVARPLFKPQPQPKLHQPAAPRVLPPSSRIPPPVLRPVRKLQPSVHQKVPPALNWARLDSEINSVASHVARQSSFTPIHNPKTLIARYYLRALLEKIQRIGDMVYTGRESGAVRVRLVINSKGEVKALEITPLAGMPRLQQMAQQILNLSAPFAPFPASLAKRTRYMKLQINMQFMGMHHVNAR